MEIRYIIINFNGDYATCQSIASGNITDIALALIPVDAEEGDLILFKDFEYTLIQ